jgi:hypothetical protein
MKGLGRSVGLHGAASVLSLPPERLFACGLCPDAGQKEWRSVPPTGSGARGEGAKK